ncbi:GNAT family N-acetyltransferase [Halobacillus salinus]|uniref:N-acetyltransferase n=1 Tax=Halobacillus salinus TaxID=192814 RepID=A0A4Z0GYD4_9BACI|nr:GNAT family N-acetyltransferase [Halobacillus salinus]TGB01641.1 N-acetyltransferase [Halobacillus salinus]
MEKSITIKEYEEENQEGVLELILQIQQDEYGIAITREDQPDLEEIPTFYQKGKGNFWVAEQQGRVIGTIALLDIGDNRLALRKMFVHTEFRGSRFRTADQLLSQALEWAESHSVESILLGTTSAFKAAHRFYEKNGFVELERSSLPEGFPVVKVDTKFYQYKI